MVAPMAASSPDAAKFVIALLSAVHEMTGRRRPPTWTHVDKVQARLATANRDAVDAAIRVAVAKRWLQVAGDPPSLVSMTADGIKLLEPTPVAPKPE